MFLAWNVYQRHWLIEPVLAVFEEETKALELLTWLSWVMPLMVYCTSFLDTLLMVVYQKWLHPWKRILAKVLTPLPDNISCDPFESQDQKSETAQTQITGRELEEQETLADKEVRCIV